MGALQRVLVVEDDLALQPFWEIFFRRQLNRFRMDWAVSSEEARRLVQGRNEAHDPYSIIITDLFLSGGETGLDLMTSSEVKDSGAQLILVSAIEAEKIRERCAEITDDNVVISKPLSLPRCERLLADLAYASSRRSGPSGAPASGVS